ncbi:MAG TPA: hypothetical protein PKL31_12390 [Fulvivirga sp.]|nr:hypothetical protein [Fulvivirga sp.]
MKEKKELNTFKDLLYDVILPKVELISLILLAIGILFKISHFQGAPQLLMISMSTYAAVCYLRAFEKIELQGAFNKFLLKIGAISSSVLVIGALFLILRLPGAINMLEIGIPVFAIFLIFIIVKFLNSESGVYKKILFRNLKTVVVVSVVYLVTLYLVN